MSQEANKVGDAFQQVHEEDSQVIQPHHHVSTEQLVQQLKETADKLLRDQTNRGDVKLLTTAVKELRYSFKVLAPFRKHRKVTIFGSARTPPDQPSYKQAIEFGKAMTKAGFMVITGAASGIMEAGHIGAGRENSIGINILLPFEQGANAVIAGDNKLLHLKYFFTRKLIFVKESDAVALFPGGFGTLDEGFEILTLIQTGKSHLFPIIMVDEPGGDYWKRWRDLIEHVLLKRGMISPADMSLFRITDSVEEAVNEVTNFYRVYHSMRYVGKDLVFRLHAPLQEPFLQRLNKDFADILVSGGFEQIAALPAEMTDPHLAAMPRLRFRFDRRNLGRLRELVDAINKAPVGEPTVGR